MRNCCWKEAKRKPLRKNPTEKLFVRSFFFFFVTVRSTVVWTAIAHTQKKKKNKERGCREREREGRAWKEGKSAAQINSIRDAPKNKIIGDDMRRKKEFGVKKRRAREISQAQIEDGGGWETRFSDGCSFSLVERNLSRKKKSKKTLLVKWGTRSCVCCGMEKELLLAVHLLFLFSKEEQRKKKKNNKDWR